MVVDVGHSDDCQRVDNTRSSWGKSHIFVNFESWCRVSNGIFSPRSRSGLDKTHSLSDPIFNILSIGFDNLASAFKTHGGRERDREIDTIHAETVRRVDSASLDFDEKLTFFGMRSGDFLEFGFLAILVED